MIKILTYKSALFGAVSFSLGCQVLFAPAATAQDASAASEPIDVTDDRSDGEDDGRLDTIIVTGTRFETPLDQVGRSVSVLTSEEIELRQQRFVFDALNAVPGVQIIRSGSFGALSSVSLRGLPSDQTLVVQDGVVLNNPASFGNGFNFANFDTADIERIEVLRGAQSTLYGSDAIGGVINIVTKDGREGFGADAFIEGGSFGTFRGAASVLGGNDIASGRVTVSGITTRGFSSADEANGNTEDDGFDNFTISSKGRFQPLENLVFDGIVRYQDSENEFDGFDFATGAADADEVGETQELSVAGFATNTLLDGKVENRFSVTYLLNDQVNLSDGVPSFDAEGTRVSAEYQGTVRPADWITVIAGAEYDVQESQVAVGFGGNQEIETISGFGLVQFQPLSFVTLNAGVRHDASPDFSDETTFSVSGVIEIPQTGTLLRGSYAEGFRAPTAGEFSFNPDLFAEFSDGWDIGLEQPLLDGRARFTVTYFDQAIDDLIAFDLAAFTFVNIQEFTSEGVEVALDARVTDWLTVNAAYTHTDALNLSTEIAAGNQPDDRFTVEFSAEPTDRLSLSLGITYNGEEEDGANILDDFVLVNLRGAYALTDKLELFARIENLNDANYQDNFGFGTAPLSGFGGVRARF
ncbi:MAG: TonB-dependent receptor [Pseudomonadota bacterium]